MIRTPLIAALAAALMGGTALAGPADSPPRALSGTQAGPSENDNSPSERGASRDYDYDEGDDSDYAPPPSAQRNASGAANSEQARADRDIFCRRDAAARTGYTTPGQAARDEQTRGTVGGTLGGAALGAILGAAGGNAGSGAAIGAGAGLLTGTIVGSSNARAAAADVERAYGDAYYSCMDSESPPPRSAAYGAPPPVYGNGYGPPPVYGYGYGGPMPYGYAAPMPYGFAPYPYYYPPYGPSVTFGFGFGGRSGWGGGRGFRGGRGWGGGRRW